MIINIDKSKNGFLAFGEGLAFFSQTRGEAAGSLIAEYEKKPEEGSQQFFELSQVVRDMHGALKHDEFDIHVVMNVQLRARRTVEDRDEKQRLEFEMSQKLAKASLGFAAISGAVADHVSGKKNIIILQQI